MTALVTSSAMNFTWPSATPASPMPGTPTAGGAPGTVGGGGAVKARGRAPAAHAGRDRPDPAAREELVQDVRQIGGVRELDRDDLELLLRHLHVDEPDDVEEAPDVGRRVRDDEHVRLAVGDERAARRDERAQKRGEVGDGP